MKRFELSINSKNSGDSIINIKELLNKADKLNLEGIAITDYNDINSFYELKKELSNHPNINYIFGTKINVNYKGLNIIIDILVKNNEGLKNLYEILTMINTNKTKDIYELFNYSEGLLIGLNLCHKNIYELLDTMLDEDIYEFIKVFDYLIITPFKDHDYIKNIINISNRYHKLLIATSNPKYLNKEDKIYYEKFIKENNQSNNYLMSTDELLKEFNYLNEKDKENIIINNPNKIYLLTEDINLNKENIYIEDKLTELRDIVYEKANELYDNKIPNDINKRIKEELSLINNINAFNLLLNKELVKLSNDLGYETTSRGGVVSFYINYLLGITKINPLDYNLDYHEFISNKDKLITIGINYDSNVIPIIKDYLTKNYNIIKCGTIKKTYDLYLDEHYKDLTKEEKNIISNIKLKHGKLPCNYFILPKNISPVSISPIIDLNDHTTMIEYHNLNKDIVRIFTSELPEIHLYNELLKESSITNIDFNDSKVWESISNNKLEEIMNFKVNNKVSNILELAKVWQQNHKTNDWYPDISYGIEYSNLYYKIAYIKYYNE